MLSVVEKNLGNVAVGVSDESTVEIEINLGISYKIMTAILY